MGDTFFSDAPKLVPAKLRLRNTFLDVEDHVATGSDDDFNCDVTHVRRGRANSEPGATICDEGRHVRSTPSAVLAVPSKVTDTWSLFEKANDDPSTPQTVRMGHINEMLSAQG